MYIVCSHIYIYIYDPVSRFHGRAPPPPTGMDVNTYAIYMHIHIGTITISGGRGDHKTLSHYICIINSMYIYVFIYIYIFIDMYTCTFVCLNILTYRYTCVNAYIYIHTYT